MTNKEKQRIQELRAKGYGYGRISEELGISKSTVSSFCKSLEEGATFCAMCGAKLKQTEGHRQKKYCSDKCRLAFWKIHRDEIHRKPDLECECPHCHKRFTTYRSKNQKYCSISCYLQARYGGKEDETKRN